MSYLLYYLPLLVQLIAGYGFYQGGNWVYAAILSFPILMLIDTILPRDYSVRKITSRFWATVPLYLASFAGLGLYFVFAWRVGQEDLTGWQVVGSVVGLAWLSVVPMVPVSHELYHYRNSLSRFVGQVAQLCYFDVTRDIAHVMGHHIDVATAPDSDTADRGLNLYSFTAGALVESTRTSMRAECAALEKRGKGLWSLGHRIYKLILAQLIIQVAFFAIGGWKAVLACLTAMLIGRIWAESFNYFQHYGLIRVPGAPIQKRHVWNHLHPLSRIFGWEIVNHADHHLDAYKPYYVLVPDTKAVKMPSVFICFATALVPPVWTNLVAKPALKEWDLTQASPEERRIAREKNRAAGWPDWFGEAAGRPASIAAE